MHSLVKPTEAAAELRVTVNTVYNWIREGRIPSVRLGGLWRIRREDLDAVTAGELAAMPPPVPVATADNVSPGGVPVPARPGPHPNAGWL
jgi:excisionase family DNA binding protein